ncbi:MAG: hypothetical protein IT314_05450 [Anaerolineales bacterium]|nr:hypothetical protein [Anaerolineales bacterium]
MNDQINENGLKFESDTWMILPEGGFKGWAYHSNFWLVKLARTNVLPRVLPKRWKDAFSTPRLIDIAKALGVSSGAAERQILEHQKRLSARLVSYSLFAIPLIFALIFIPFFALLIAFPMNGISIFFSVPFFLSMGVPFEVFLLKAIFILFDKYYADSLCVQASLGVLVELARPQALNNPSRKRYLLFYISEAARYTLLLPLCFRSSSRRVNEKIQNHFHKIERFIREQERRAIMPESDSIMELQKNFLQLTHLFISGNYGEFEWQEEEEITLSSVETHRKWYQHVFSFLGKTVGLGIPLTGLYFTFAKPSIFSWLPFDVNTVSLVALAWLFLSIDSILQLGLTAKVVATAKEIKDLL